MSQPAGDGNARSYDVITARILISGLVISGLACIVGIVAIDLSGRTVPAILGHLASAIAGGLLMGVNSIFRPNGSAAHS